MGCMLRVRTGPECPEDNLRELTWDSNPNCGIAREREKKKRERENIPTKSSNLRHRQVCSQNKGLSKYQRRASWLRTGPSPATDREAGRRQPQPERGNLGPRDSILYQTASRLPGAKSSWDPGQLTSAGRVAARDQLPRGDTRHTWDSTSAVHPGNQAAGTGEVIRHIASPGESALTKHLVTWAAWTWEGHKTQAHPSLRLCGVPEEPEPEWLRPGKGTQPRPALESCRATWSLSSVDWESTHAVSGANPVWPRHCEHSPRTPVIFVCSAPASPQHDWTSEPK